MTLPHHRDNLADGTGAHPDEPARLLSLPLLVGVLCFGIALANSQVFLDPDTYWHLAAGEWILANRGVPTADPFSHSMPGAPWVAHEWGAQLLITLAHRIGGWAALHVLVASAYAGTLAYLTRFLVRRMEPLHALMCATVAAILLLTHLLARPHVIAWPLMAVWVGALVDAAERGRTPRWWLLGLVVLWANMHLSYVLGFLIGGGIALDAIAGAPDASTRWDTARRWAVFFGVATLCLLVNPHGWHALVYTVDVMGMKSLALVSEWRSADFHRFQPLIIWIVLVFGLALGGRLTLSWPRTALVLGMFYLALKHGRYHSLLGLVTPFLLAAPIARGILGSRTGDPATASLDRMFTAMTGRATLAGRAMAVAACGAFVALRLGIAPAVPLDFVTPRKAVDAAMAHPVEGEVLNAYLFGGYLIYRDVPVAIDGRSDMYGDDYMQLFSDGVMLRRVSAIDSLLANPRVGWTLLPPGTPAIALLDRLPAWRRVYADSVAVVHVRTGGVAAPVAQGAGR